MRLAVFATLATLATACTIFDPIEEVPHHHREYATTRAAVQAILDENPRPAVYAVGEYHQTRLTASTASSLAWFTQDIIGLLEPMSSDLVVESWDASCYSPVNAAAKVAAATQRSAATQMEVMRLVKRSQQIHLPTHTLPMTCIEYDAIVDASGHVNFLLLLELVTEKLRSVTLGLFVGRASDTASEKAIVVYGGALHNDLYPRWPLEELSYATALERSLGPGRVLEIDLVVPEIVAQMEMVRREPWFPLIGRASPSRAIVWKRGPSSYVVILPAQSEEVARVAKPLEPM